MGGCERGCAVLGVQKRAKQAEALFLDACRGSAEVAADELREEAQVVLQNGAVVLLDERRQLFVAPLPACALLSASLLGW